MEIALILEGAVLQSEDEHIPLLSGGSPFARVALKDLPEGASSNLASLRALILRRFSSDVCSTLFSNNEGYVLSSGEFIFVSKGAPITRKQEQKLRVSSFLPTITLQSVHSHNSPISLPSSHVTYPPHRRGSHVAISPLVTPSVFLRVASSDQDPSTISLPAPSFNPSETTHLLRASTDRTGAEWKLDHDDNIPKPIRTHSVSSRSQGYSSMGLTLPVRHRHLSDQPERSRSRSISSASSPVSRPDHNAYHIGTPTQSRNYFMSSRTQQTNGSSKYLKKRNSSKKLTPDMLDAPFSPSLDLLLGAQEQAASSSNNYQIVIVGQSAVEPSSDQKTRPPKSIVDSGEVRVLDDVNQLLQVPIEHLIGTDSSFKMWIAVEDAPPSIVQSIGKHFGLHPLTIEDCSSPRIREKLEVFPSYLFLVFHALDVECDGEQDTEETHKHHEIITTSPIRLIVFSNSVISFHKSDLPSLSLVRKRLAKLYNNRIENPAWLIHAILDCITDSLFPIVRRMVQQVESVDDVIYHTGMKGKEHKELLKQMSIINRSLNFLKQRLWSKRDILVSLLEKDWQSFLKGVQVPYLRDIYDHLVVMLHQLDASSELLESLQNTYLSIVSIDVAAATHVTNHAMKKLSAAATILLPMSLVAGIMGMNVTVPFQTGVSPPPTFVDVTPFNVICFSMVVAAVVLFCYFKKKDLI